ncbi:ankyrin repeat domain-containing protein 26 isoform X10 [Paroedura picta]|uniref:ankyrin repeat domain-containing protein 26 isoform X10 n=1 Tax=Paroedura picta TaxID=143630 RepID=UPI00405608A9
MKKFFGFARKKEQPSGSRSAAAAPPSPSPNALAGGGYKLRKKDLSRLHRAAASGNLGKLQHQLAKKHDLNQLDKANRTPLHLACANGCTDVVHFLVDNKCKLNLCDNDNRSPLMKAVQCQQEFCASYLLKHGADTNVVDLSSNTALHFAASNSSVSIAEQLLEYNAKADAQNKDGNTPLILAVTGGNQEMAEFLLKKGASVHARDNSGRTSLMTAASNGDDALINLLIQYGAEASDKDKNGWAAEDYALMSGYYELCKKLQGYCRRKYAQNHSSKNRKGLYSYSSPDKDRDSGLTWGAPATNKEVVDDESVDSSSKTNSDSWFSEDDLFDSEKQQKCLPKKVREHIRKYLHERSSIIRPDHTASSELNISNCEAEDMNKCIPKPLSPAKSFPQPAHSSLGSFPKPIQMSTSRLGIKQEAPSEEFDNDDGGDGDKEDRRISVLDRNVICYSNSRDQNPLQDSSFKRGRLQDTQGPGRTELTEKQKSKLMEELGLDEADINQDTSDWDSANISLESVPYANPLYRLVLEDNSQNDAATKKSEIIPLGVELSDAQTVIPLKGEQCNEQQDIKENENDENKCSLESPRRSTVDCLPKSSTKDVVQIHGITEESRDGKLEDTQEMEETQTREKQDSSNVCYESDWESISISLQSELYANSFYHLVLEDNGRNDAATKKSEIVPVGVVLSDAQAVIPLKGEQCNEQQDIKEIENDANKVEEEKQKQKWEQLETTGKNENPAIDSLTVIAIEQEVKEKLTLKENHYVESEGEMVGQSQVKNIISSVERKELIPVPAKSTKNVRKSESKRRISKQRVSEKLQDDSSFSEPSVEEERKSTRTMNGNNKIPRTVGITNSLDDLTQSSDTTTEDIVMPSSVSREAEILIEQLTLDNTADAVSLLKIQNVIHGYERLIEHEKGRYAQLRGKVKKNETEKKELQRILEEMREVKSLLDHQKVQWESNVNSLKFSLKQAEEKKMSAEILYEKSQEQLRKKEEQYYKELEEKQQLELMLRSLEMELRTLKNHLKQVEEHHNDMQRQLTQEQNARVLQEGIWNSYIWRQKELEDESKRTLAKSSEMADHHDQEKDLLCRNQILQNEIAVLRLELDQIKVHYQEEETRYIGENEALKEKNEELKKELKLNEEALTQTVFQYNGQINVTRTESAMLNSKLERMKEDKGRLEVEFDSYRSRLNFTTQELERTNTSKNDLERTLQRERDEWVRLKDKWNHDLSNLQETNNSISQQLSKTESKANSLENELQLVTHTLREKNLLIEGIQRDLSQAQCRVKELENARQMEKDQINKYVVKQESLQERLAQLHSENLLLRQQLEDFQNQGIIKERVVSSVQDRFNDIFTKLRAESEKQFQMIEDRNKELLTKCNNLRDQVFKYETEKAEREGALRQLQQELADSLKKQSMSEATLEITTRYRNHLEEDKQELQKEIESMKSKLQQSEEQYIHSQRCIQDLRSALDAKESKVNVLPQNFQDLLLASSGVNAAVKSLEEHIQRLEKENARLEATNKEQTSRIEILQKDLQDSAFLHSRLEELITVLQTTKVHLEEQLNHQKQTVLSITAQDTHNMLEEELKSRTKLDAHLSELDKEKTALLAQFDNENKKVKKLAELKRSMEVQLNQEMKRNSELQKECNEMKKLLKIAKKKLKEYESEENSSQTDHQEEMKSRYSEMDLEVGKLKTKIEELSHQLEMESTRCNQLKSTNRDLQEQLSYVKILHKDHEKLEKSKLQLENEVANLRRHVQSNTMDYNQREQYKREVEEQARQEIRQKLEEVNLFLQTQAASQETLEQMRATNNASLKNQLENRIANLQSELARLKKSQQDNIYHRESIHTELEKYKGLYLEELKTRKALGSKLDRANDKLSEANAKLLHERQKNKSLLTSGFVSGSLSANPGLETIPLGNLSSNLTLNGTLSLGGGFINPSGNALSSKTRVEAYLAKMREELEKNITRELDQATTELHTGYVRVTPLGSTNGSSKNINMDQDEISTAAQQYLDVLKKNYML